MKGHPVFTHDDADDDRKLYLKCQAVALSIDAPAAAIDDADSFK